MFLIVPFVFIAVFSGGPKTPTEPMAVKVSPPLIMKEELVLRQYTVLPPPTPVSFTH